MTEFFSWLFITGFLLNVQIFVLIIEYFFNIMLESQVASLSFIVYF